MHTGHINHATRNLNAPKDWDRERDGFCGVLPVRDEMTAAGQAMTSAWYPTPEEIKRISEGAPVYLSVMGTIHPPVSMGVGPRPGFEG